MTTAATSSSHPSEDINNNVNSLSLGQALDYGLDILKIREASESYRNTTQKTITKVPLAIIKTDGSWITAMKLIADCSGMLNYNNKNGHVLSQTGLYDFLTYRYSFETMQFLDGLLEFFIEDSRGEQTLSSPSPFEEEINRLLKSLLSSPSDEQVIISKLNQEKRFISIHCNINSWTS